MQLQNFIYDFESLASIEDLVSKINAPAEPQVL